MEQPSVLPTKKYDRQTKTTLPRAKYVVSGDREVRGGRRWLRFLLAATLHRRF